MDEFNKEQDKKFYELNEKFQEMQNKLEEQHNSQLKDLQQKYEDKYSNYIINPSPELINLNKNWNYMYKKKIIKMPIKHKLILPIWLKKKKKNL